jgi:signal transduction histidine kinase
MILGWLKRVDERTPFTLKLLGLIAGTIVIGVSTVYLLSNKAIEGNFSTFSRHSSLLHAEGMVPFFAYYYATNGGWEGVERFVNTSAEHHLLGDRLVLLDERAGVVLGAEAKFDRERLDGVAASLGVPVLVDGDRVGTVLTESMLGVPTLLDLRFRASLNRAILLAGLAAAVVAAVLALLLVRRITAPLRQLTRATEDVAAGRLEQRVAIHSRDELGQLGKAFNVMAEKLARSEKLRRDMVADIAHELRTPLTVMQGNLQAILDGVYAPSEENLTLILNRGVLLARLIDDLRELSLVDAGELALDWQLLELSMVVSHAATLAKAQMREKNISLVVEAQAAALEVEADRSRLDQVLMNLLSNAQRHTPGGGTVTLRCWAEGANALVQVADSGPGIPPEHLPYVFERFWRGDRSRDRSRGGTGLGLAIAKGLVEAHGGRIWAESLSGQGAVFTLSLPLVKHVRERDAAAAYG